MLKVPNSQIVLTLQKQLTLMYTKTLFSTNTVRKTLSFSIPAPKEKHPSTKQHTAVGWSKYFDKGSKMLKKVKYR